MTANKVKRNIVLGASLVLFFAAVLMAWQIMEKKRPMEIICIPKIIDVNSDFWSSLVAGAQMGAKEMDVNLTLMAPDEESDYKEQNRLIREAIAKKPDAIVLSPSDYHKNTKAAKEVKAAGIKLILIDSGIDEDVADSCVSTDNIKAGALLGSALKEFVKAGSKIAIVNHVKDSSTAIEREKGVRKALGEDEGRVVGTVFSDSLYKKAYVETNRILRENPDIDLIGALNEYSSTGAARAVKDMGLGGKVIVIGFDNSIEEIEFLENGVCQGLVIQKSFNMGYLGIETAVKCIKGEKVEKQIDSGAKIVRKKDMYTEENQKLLFPFWGKQ